MQIKIGLIGASGKLGSAIQQLHPVTPIFRDTKRENIDCDVVIDVSEPESLKGNLSSNKPIVIGTTGHKDFSLIEKASATLPIFYAANFSLGVALLHELAKIASDKFPSDIDIIESHRKGKKDIPSGTALSLAKVLKNPTIHSIRAADVVGEHTISFHTPEEKITLSHHAYSRTAFAKGAIAAAYFLINKPAGLYGMDNLLTETVPLLAYAKCSN